MKRKKCCTAKASEVENGAPSKEEQPARVIPSAGELPKSISAPRKRRSFVLDHFNDCYLAEEAPKYKHFLDHLGKPGDCVRVFGGDLFGPNTFKKWKPITRCGVEMGIDVAAMGNHEFDYGSGEYHKAMNYIRKIPPQTDGKPLRKGFEFLMGNIYIDVPDHVMASHKKDGTLIPEKYMIGGDTEKVNREGYCRPWAKETKNKHRIGFIAYADDSWQTKMGFQFKRNHTIYVEDPWVSVRRYAKILREDPDDPCDVIILVSHANWPTDVKVAEKLGSDVIDMILTGHDHFLRIENISNVPVLNSGAHFKWFTRTHITISDSVPTSTTTERKQNNNDTLLAKGEDVIKRKHKIEIQQNIVKKAQEKLGNATGHALKTTQKKDKGR